MEQSIDALQKRPGGDEPRIEPDTELAYRFVLRTQFHLFDDLVEWNDV